MKAARILAVLFATFCLNALADDLVLADNASGNPYQSVVERNIFGLVPIPTNPPAETKPPDPPTKITPNGIMSIFGQLQALFKVALPPKAGQPPHDQSYMLSEGERQDDIEVIKIDNVKSTITFNNHGIIQELPLVSAPNATAPAGPVGATSMPVPRFNGGRPNGAGFRGPQGNAPLPGNLSTGNNPSVPNNAGASGGNNAPTQEHLTPEAQVIMMEAQRAQLLQQGDHPDFSPAIIPPTPLTAQVIGNPDDSTEQGGSGNPNP